MKSGTPSLEKIRLHYSYRLEYTDVISIGEKGFSFGSSSQNCLVESYNLMQKDLNGAYVASDDPNI